MKFLSLKSSRKADKTNSGNNPKITQKTSDMYLRTKNLEMEKVKRGQRN